MRARRIGVLIASAALSFSLVPAAQAHPQSASFVPAIESRTLQIVNGGRARVGQPALRPDAGLTSVARPHSQRMAARGWIGHDGFAQRVRGRGSAACENVAMFRPARPVSNEAVAQKLYSLWYNSLSHRRCMLDAGKVGYNIAGVGVYRDSRGGYWATLELVRTGARATTVKPSTARAPSTTSGPQQPRQPRQPRRAA